MGVGLLLLGAVGSGIDAVLHLLAYAMTEPGLERGSLLELMAFMQGPGLRLIGPFVPAPLWTAHCVREGTSHPKNEAAHLCNSTAIAVVGGAGLSEQSERYSVISLAQACVGVELTRIHEHARFAAAA